jgi:hypothetical protein
VIYSWPRDKTPTNCWDGFCVLHISNLLALPASWLWVLIIYIVFEPTITLEIRV